METQFTPLLSFGGGALIGLSAVLLMATNGRIAGISGIVSRLLPGSGSSEGPSTGVMFIIGLLLAVPFYMIFAGQGPQQTVSSNLPLLAVAGLLVGFGATYGNGCTSGHGVCGMSRLSSRSIIATVCFMLTAFITVFVMRHVVGG